MEELRSTDVLDKEIFADAKKKAEKILSQADETCSELLSGVDARVAEAKSKATADAQLVLDSFTKNISASFPLERERYLVSYIHNSLVDAINLYFEKAGEQKQLLVIQKLLERSKDVLGEGAVNVKCIGIEKDAAEKLVSGTIKNPVQSLEKADAVLISDEVVEGFNFRKGILISTVDGKVSCRMTLDQKVKELLDDYSFELAEALFNGRIPE